MLRLDQRRSNPARRQDAAEVTVREQRDVSIQRAQFLDEVEYRLQDFLGCLAALRQRVFPVHQHFQLDDWDQFGLLAQGGIACQRMRADLDTTPVARGVEINDLGRRCVSGSGKQRPPYSAGVPAEERKVHACVMRSGSQRQWHADSNIGPLRYRCHCHCHIITQRTFGHGAWRAISDPYRAGHLCHKIWQASNGTVAPENCGITRAV